MEVTTNVVFQILNESKKRISVMQGGTRSGKTYNVLTWFIVKLLQEKGKTLTICRSSLPSIKGSVMRDFIEILSKYGLYSEEKHNKSENLYFLNGNTVEFVSTDQPQKIRGRKRHYLFINEANEVNYESWMQLALRTTDKIVLDYNPSDYYSWIYDKVIPREDTDFTITTYKDNPFLTQSQIEDIESRKSNQYWWTIYGSGERANRQGAIFTNWMHGDFDNSLPYVYGQDYGFSVDPTTLVKVAVDEKKKIIYADEKFYSTVGMGTNEIFEANKQATKPNELIIADSAEPRLIDDLRRKGTNIIPCEKVQEV